MKKVIAYIRVSTLEQDTLKQKGEIERYCTFNNLTINKFIERKISSRKQKQNRGINEIMDSLTDESILIVTELSRLGRSTGETLDIIDTIVKSGAEVRFLKENMVFSKHTEDPASKAMLGMLAVFAQFERDTTSLRVKESLKTNKDNGVAHGRPKGSIGFSKLDGKEEYIKEHLEMGINKTALSLLLKVSRPCLISFINSRIEGKKKVAVKGVDHDNFKLGDTISNNMGVGKVVELCEDHVVKVMFETKEKPLRMMTKHLTLI